MRRNIDGTFKKTFINETFSKITVRKKRKSGDNIENEDQDSHLTLKVFGFCLKIYKCPESNAGRGPLPLTGPGAERRAIAPRQGGTPVGVGFGTLRNFQTKSKNQKKKLGRAPAGPQKNWKIGALLVKMEKKKRA